MWSCYSMRWNFTPYRVGCVWIAGMCFDFKFQSVIYETERETTLHYKVNILQLHCDVLFKNLQQLSRFLHHQQIFEWCFHEFKSQGNTDILVVSMVLSGIIYKIIWRSPSLSELTSMIYNTGLTHLSSKASINNS